MQWVEGQAEGERTPLSRDEVAVAIPWTADGSDIEEAACGGVRESTVAHGEGAHSRVCLHVHGSFVDCTVAPTK